MICFLGASLTPRWLVPFPFHSTCTLSIVIGRPPKVYRFRVRTQSNLSLISLCGNSRSRPREILNPSCLLASDIRLFSLVLPLLWRCGDHLVLTLPHLLLSQHLPISPYQPQHFEQPQRGHQLVFKLLHLLLSQYLAMSPYQPQHLEQPQKGQWPSFATCRDRPKHWVALILIPTSFEVRCSMKIQADLFIIAATCFWP